MVLLYLLLLGFSEYCTNAEDKVFIYWRSIQEYAHVIYTWAQKTGRIGSVESLVDICQDEENKDQLFFDVPVQIISKACEALSRENKAEVFYSENTDEYGVKFFSM